MPNDSANPKSVFPPPHLQRHCAFAHLLRCARLFLTPLIRLSTLTLLCLQNRVSFRVPCQGIAFAHLISSVTHSTRRPATTRYDGPLKISSSYRATIGRDLWCRQCRTHSHRTISKRHRHDMYRIVLRQNLLNTLDALLTLRTELLRLAKRQPWSLMPAYTHNQPAQPTTLGH